MNPHGEDIEGMTHCLTDYLNICTDVVSPVKTVRCYPNNKPWVTREVKTVLNKKKAAFRSRYREAMKAAQQEVKHCVKEAKDSYRRKVEQKLRENPHEGKQHEGSQGRCEDHHRSQHKDQSRREGQWRGSQGRKPRTATGRKVEQKLRENPYEGKQHEGSQGSLQIGRVPTLWKTSRIVPVPKKNRPSELNDFRPVALTSHLMKTLERLFLSLLRPQVQHAQDRLQFAYQPGVGVEDAILYLLHRAHSHLDKGSGTVRILFLDFSSAFNTIQPTLLRDKLSRMGVDPQLMDWISDLPHWQTTTKELVIDFGRSRPRPRPVLLEGAEVEAVDSYRYLGLWIDNKLDWTTHTSHLYGKTQSRMYFLRRLRSFNICSKLLQMFYQSVVASVLFYTVVCWGGSISKKDTSRLDKLIRRAGSVVGMKLDSLVTVAESRTLDKLLDIMDNASHPLHTVISNQRSLFSERLLLPKCRTNRLKNSFVHHAITLYNSSHKGGGGHRSSSVIP
ncbi:hypothetical protein L3Q82_026475 [Scortum barcoo]|uniref:Uncharacterized protein n=1 Tax=Scortum barcoo TaxID=214431 RepID=A0ACB8WIE8_9TELE|nr:hypothetical protein L3Q82_026475 [Scortum barcoo]